MHGRVLGAVLAALLVVGACVVGAASGTAAAPTADSGATRDATSTRAPSSSDDLIDTSLTAIAEPPAVTARGWLVMDSATGEPVGGLEPTVARPVASLAKLMTAHVVVERLDLNAKVEIPPEVNDLPADAARMDARAGESWTASDLLRAMLVHSANDAALALAIEVGDGDEQRFVELMNEAAEELRLDSTKFASSTGLDRPGATSTSTPLDMSLLARVVLQQEPIATAVAEKQITLTRPGDDGEEIVLTNRNPLLGKVKGVDGVKTGFTDAARYMLVAHLTDAKTGASIIATTFGSTSEKTRAADSRALLAWAQPFWVDVLAIEAGTPIASVPIQGTRDMLEVFACDDVRVTARVGERLEREVSVPRSVAAPIRAGDELGEVRVTVVPAHDGRPLSDPSSLCASTDVEVPSRIDTIRDHVDDVGDAWQSGVAGVRDGQATMERLVG